MTSLMSRWSCGVLASAFLFTFYVVAGSTTGYAATRPSDIGAADLVVKVVRGELGGAEREIAVKDNVFSEENIETGSDSAARLVFRDGTKLSMGPSAQVKLNKFVYDPDKKDGSLLVKLVSGVFRFISGDMPHDSYQIGTPFANLAVRGTSFFVETNLGFVYVRSGGVVATLPSGDAKLINPDQCLVRATGQQFNVAEGSTCSTILAEIEQQLASLDALQLFHLWSELCKKNDQTTTGSTSSTPTQPIATPTVTQNQETEEQRQARLKQAADWCSVRSFTQNQPPTNADLFALLTKYDIYAFDTDNPIDINGAPIVDSVTRVEQLTSTPSNQGGQSVVPVPAALPLFGSAVIGLVWLRRRRAAAALA